MAKSGILSAERLNLHPFNESYLTPRYVAWLNDPDTVRFSEQRHRKHTLETCRAYAMSFDASPSYFWAIVAHDPSLGHIGNMTATVDMPNRVANLAIMIGEAVVRGHGFGLEAWHRACDFLIGEGGMRKVVAGTMAINEPMLAIMRASGMIEESRKPQHFIVDGKQIDLVTAALFAP